MKNIKIFFISIIAILLLQACSSKPTHIELVIKSSSNLNPDVNGVPSPLMITLYELDSAEKFMKYDYWTLQSRSGKNLADDLISQAKHVISPSKKHTYKIAFDKRAKFLGIVGKFRDIKKDKAWKYVINLEKDVYNFSELKINEFDIQREE